MKIVIKNNPEFNYLWNGLISENINYNSISPLDILINMIIDDGDQK